MSIALALVPAVACADQLGDCSRKADPERSVPACTEIIERGSARQRRDLSAAYLTRGNAYFSKGDNDRAIADFDVAIQLKLYDAKAYIKRGFAHAAKDDYTRAIVDFGMAIKLRPNNASPYTMRADAYENAGERDRAIADYRRALEIDPSLEVAKAALERLGLNSVTIHGEGGH